MPTWIKHKLEFNGEKEKVNLFLKQFESLIKNETTGKIEKNYFDFNTIIPMPEDLSIDNNEKAIIYYATDRCTKNIRDMTNNKYCLYVDGHSILFSAAYYYNCLLTTSNIYSQQDFDDMYNTGKKLCNNIDNYGYSHWYDWCKANWGCKWTSCETQKENNIITFLTSYSVPMKVYDKLSQLCEDAKIAITIKYASEECGLRSGRITGGILANTHYTYPKYSQLGYENYIEVWGKGHNPYLKKVDGKYVITEEK